MIIFKPEGVCATEIRFDIIEGRIKNLTFIGGCPGNLNAISKLVEGMKIEEVIEKFAGNICQNGTSCTDQLAKALQSAYIKHS
ncbi:MAG: TIGR03905 family TSCPD domain-containing protein [Bacillota bacterium]